LLALAFSINLWYSQREYSDPTIYQPSNCNFITSFSLKNQPRINKQVTRVQYHLKMLIKIMIFSYKNIKIQVKGYEHQFNHKN